MYGKTKQQSTTPPPSPKQKQNKCWGRETRNKNETTKARTSPPQNKNVKTKQSVKPIPQTQKRVGGHEQKTRKKKQKHTSHPPTKTIMLGK
jgi:hypothetical protein